MIQNKIRILKVIGIIFLISLNLGCQATPKDEIIQSKKNQILIQKNRDNIPPYLAPKRWEETFSSSNGQLEIILDSDVLIQDTDKYPIITLKPSDITQEEADKMMKVLIGDKNLYQTSADVILLTKDVIEFQLKALSELLDSQELSKDDIEKCKERIDFLKKEYKNAPDTRYEEKGIKKFTSISFNKELIRVDKEWKENKTVYGKSASKEDYLKRRQELLDNIKKATFVEISGIVNLDETREGYLRIKKSSDKINNGISYIVYDLNRVLYGQINENNLELPKLTKEEAYKVAKKTLEDMGIDYMEGKYVESPSQRIFFKGEERVKIAPCKEYPYYPFVFTRKTGNVLSTYVPPDLRASNPYVTNWHQEYIYIVIGDSGVKAFTWNYPSEEIEKLADNVELLSFEEIQKIFKNQIIINNIWHNFDSHEKYIIGRELHITEIRLGTMAIRQQDNKDEYILVPVWDFFGKHVTKYSENYPVGSDDTYKVDENNRATFEYEIAGEPNSLLTINAIDGTIIDRRKGY